MPHPLPATGPVQGSGGAGRQMWGDPVAWLVSIYMGTQSTAFYVISTWFAAYRTSSGTSPVSAGIELMIFQLLGIAGSLLIPFAGRGRLKPWVPALLPILGLTAWVGFVVAPASVWLWLLLGGVTCGAQLTIALTLMAERARAQSHATALSGMAQSLGYAIAAIGPFMFGLLHDWTGAWTAPFALLWLAAGTQFAVGVALRRPRYVLETRRE